MFQKKPQFYCLRASQEPSLTYGKVTSPHYSPLHTRSNIPFGQSCYKIYFHPLLIQSFRVDDRGSKGKNYSVHADCYGDRGGGGIIIVDAFKVTTGQENKNVSLLFFDLLIGLSPLDPRLFCCLLLLLHLFPLLLSDFSSSFFSVTIRIIVHLGSDNRGPTALEGRHSAMLTSPYIFFHSPSQLLRN
jgi:hypothetical protein